MPLLIKPPVGFALVLDPDMEREALEELADELARSWTGEIQEAFPNGAVGLSVPLKPAERLGRYIELTKTSDIALLAQPHYVENARLGLAELPVSQYWLRLVQELPKAAEQNIQDFIRLLRGSDIEMP